MIQERPFFPHEVVGLSREHQLESSWQYDADSIFAFSTLSLVPLPNNPLLTIPSHINLTKHESKTGLQPRAASSILSGLRGFNWL